MLSNKVAGGNGLAKPIALMSAFVVVLTLFVGVSSFASAQEARPDIENTFEIWATESEVSQAWHSTIRGRICPGPTSDVEERDPVSDPESGRITDPGSSIVVSVYLIAPNGTQVLLEESEVEDGSFLCSQGASAGFFPDAAGNFTFYGVAKWSQNDSINKVRSNNVSILVKPAIYQTSGSEVLAENVQIDRLMDLSPDGESILALDIVVDSPDVSFSMDLLLFRLIDPDSFETIVLPFDTKTLQFARFSPSGDKILIVGEPYGQDRNQAISYNLADGNVTVVAASMQDSDINSAVWVKGQNGDEIAYGE
ncbi:MAG TPA: hypothetical protein VF172_05815, partial [Nitrososphaera sp.]